MSNDLITKTECIDKWNGTVPTQLADAGSSLPVHQVYHMTSFQSGFFIFLVVLCLFIAVLCIKDAIRLKRMGSTSGALPMLYCLIFCTSCMAVGLLRMVIVYW